MTLSANLGTLASAALDGDDRDYDDQDGREDDDDDDDDPISLALIFWETT